MLGVVNGIADAIDLRDEDTSVCGGSIVAEYTRSLPLRRVARFSAPDRRRVSFNSPKADFWSEAKASCLSLASGCGRL